MQPFATVPYIRTPGEVRRKRAIIAAALAVIVVGIPAALFAIHTYYMPIDLLVDDGLAKVGIAAEDPPLPEQ